VYGIDSLANFMRAAERLRALRPAARFAVHLGDATATATSEAYAAFGAACASLSMPLYPVVGNHDDPALLWAECPLPPGTDVWGAGAYSFTAGSVHAVVLNSRLAGAVGGDLDAGQLDWLARDLAAHPAQHVCVFVHHPPAPVGIAWLDAVRLASGPALLAALAGAGGAARVFCGHVHRYESLTQAGIAIVTAPSTWVSFGPDPENSRVDAGQGYLVVDAGADGISVTAEPI